jgi:nitroreductase
MDALTALTTRASAAALIDPAPDDAALQRMLQAAVAAPDHGRLKPWRFIAVRGEARRRLGEVLAEALAAREPGVPEALLAKEKEKPFRAPLILVAAAKLIPQHKIPAIEQIVAVGAAAQNLMLAAHALGYGAMWKTGAPAYDARVKQALGLTVDDQIVGFLYLGTPTSAVTAGNRPAPESCLVEWRGPAA